MIIRRPTIKRVSRKEYFKSYRETNKDKIVEKGKVYYAANKDKIKAYHEANKEKIAEYYKAYYETNKDKFKAHYEANKEKILKRFRNTHINIPLFGGRRGKRSMYTDGVTNEIKEQLPKIVNDVLEDCIKNPRKFLDDGEITKSHNTRKNKPGEVSSQVS